MYGKVFASMYDGTLAGNWQAIVTLQQMIVLCDIDGVIDMTPQALSARTSIPLDIIQTGIEHLEKPDPYSRTQESDGRRIERLDEHRAWGWRLVNYTKYRHLKDAEMVRAQNRERQQRHRSTSQDVTPCHSPSQSVTLSNTNKRQVEVDVEVDVEASTNSHFSNEKSTTSKKIKNSVPYEAIVSLYHEKLPKLPKCIKLTNQRKGYIRQRWLEDLPDMEAWGKYFDIVKQSKFLMGQANSTGGRPPFRADLPWLCRPENVVKVIEGKYHRG